TMIQEHIRKGEDIPHPSKPRGQKTPYDQAPRAPLREGGTPSCVQGLRHSQSRIGAPNWNSENQHRPFVRLQLSIPAGADRGPIPGFGENSGNSNTRCSINYAATATAGNQW